MLLSTEFNICISFIFYIDIGGLSLIRREFYVICFIFVIIYIIDFDTIASEYSKVSFNRIRTYFNRNITNPLNVTNL